ncbi:hypothetical protein FACS1894189_7580 [Planctomycetales bacterium]|nr:hypothetical protein FACS1894189_7580 [Planctomycetales bacterium]
MPANLTPIYKKAEEQYRRAETQEEELKWLQVMLAEMPKHKGTDHLQAKLKTQISQLRKDIEQSKSSGGKKGGGAVVPFGFPGKEPGQQLSSAVPMPEKANCSPR